MNLLSPSTDSIMFNNITNSIMFNDILLSSSKDLIAFNVDFLLLLIQKYVLKNDFVVIKKRFKMNKRAKVYKVWLRYTRESKIRENVNQKKNMRSFVLMIIYLIIFWGSIRRKLRNAYTLKMRFTIMILKNE